MATRIDKILSGTILAGFALAVFFVLKRAFGRKRTPPPPTPPGPYENEKNDRSGGGGLPWP